MRELVSVKKKGGGNELSTLPQKILACEENATNAHRVSCSAVLLDETGITMLDTLKTINVFLLVWVLYGHHGTAGSDSRVEQTSDP